MNSANHFNELDGVHLATKARVRFGVIALSLLCTTSIGAATVKTVVNADPPMCAQLLNMVRDAGIPEMTDAQLCDFRFSGMPTSMTQGFIFPHWRKIAVADADAPAMYLRMITANRSPHSKARRPDYALAQNAAQQAVNDKNLVFYTGTVPVSGLMLEKNMMLSKPVSTRNLTFVSMALRRCSKLQDVLPSPFFAVFEKPDLMSPVPVAIDMSGKEIALWKGAPVLLYVSYRWEAIPPLPTGINVRLDNLWWSEGAKGRLDAAITGGTHCSFTIDK